MPILRQLPAAVAATVFLLTPMHALSASEIPNEDRVDFASQCEPSAAQYLQAGVYQMHHMMYELARSHFEAASEQDPDCGLAYWGQAMTYIHPLWPDRPSPEVISIGFELAEIAEQLGGHDDRENRYIKTPMSYFRDGASLTEKERLNRFEDAWLDVFERYPEDQDAKAFYALAQIATADPNDKTYTQRIEAGARAEEVLVAVPNHPGAQHYIIHAFDVPGLAERALPVARQYGVIAPKVPHALHMMSHIFTRLGLWEESAKWNEESAAAALKVSNEAGAVSMHYLHALDYLVYAYLQQGKDEKAMEVTRIMADLNGPFGKTLRIGMAYAFAASPARIALEQRDWHTAAILEPRIPGTFPWEDDHAPYLALTHFSRGLGLANIGKFEEAKRELKILRELRDRTKSTNDFWANQIDIQQKSVEAWIIFLEGDKPGGLAVMQSAAAREDLAEKSPVTPGEIVPAAELLGDMYMLLDQHDEALKSYRVVLKRSPRRLNSLYGAGQALQKSGHKEEAKAYFSEITTMTNDGSVRPRIVVARNLGK